MTAALFRAQPQGRALVGQREAVLLCRISARRTSRVAQGRVREQLRIHRTSLCCRAELGAESPPWTPDQIAGLAFGAFLVLAVYLARQVDVIVARSQRRELGLCEECGGLFDPKTCEEWRCPQK